MPGLDRPSAPWSRPPTMGSAPPIPPASLRGVVTALGFGALVSLAATLLLSIAAPLYTDEIGFKTQVSRAFVEGHTMVSLFPQCTSAHELAIPASWVPAAALFDLLFRPLGLLGLKVSGVVIAFLWFGLAWHVLGKLGRGPARTRRFIIFSAAHSLGLVPFVLVMARAEGTLLVCLLGFACFAIADWVRPQSSVPRTTVLLALFVLLASVFFFGHPKALFFTPAIVLAGWFGFERRGRAWASLAAIWVLITAGQSFMQAGRAGRCPEAPHIEDTFALFVLSPSLARTDPGAFVRLGFQNVERSARAIATDMELTPTYPSGWLPPLEPAGEKLGAGMTAANIVTRAGLRALELAACVLAVVGVAATRRAKGRMRRSACFAAALLFCLVGHLFFTKFWPFYNTAFAVAQLALVMVLAGAAVASRAQSLRRLGGPAAALIVGATLFGSLATVFHLGPRLIATASSDRLGTLLPTQPASVSPFHYAREREAIRRHATRCRIMGDGATRLVVDDATFFAFDDLRRPIHLLYVSDASMWGLSMPGEKDVAFLRDLHVAGIITRCSFLPTALSPRMIRDDRGYCCLGPDDLQSPP